MPIWDDELGRTPEARREQENTPWYIRHVPVLIAIAAGVALLILYLPSLCSVTVQPSSTPSSRTLPTLIQNRTAPTPSGNTHALDALQSQPSTTDITGPLSTITYWTPSGKSYHFRDTCPSLSRSSEICAGTLRQALDADKLDPCNICAGGAAAMNSARS